MLPPVRNQSQAGCYILGPRSDGVTDHHLARAFGVLTGQSLMRYVRGRRLTEAARSLAAGEPDILKVALEAGYGSHEAFTRAFREQFQVTPEDFRSARSLSRNYSKFGAFLIGEHRD